MGMRLIHWLKKGNSYMDNITCSELRRPVFKAIHSFHPKKRLQLSVLSIQTHRSLSLVRRYRLNRSNQTRSEW